MTGPPLAVRAVRSAVRAGLADLPPGGLLLVACSGGADSVALAAATAFEAPRRGLRAGAVTVDHGLQPGSAERARALAAWLPDLGLDPVEVVTGSVSGSGGPEAAARAARYAALDTAADRLAAAAVLLGHTLDDQAETVLLGLGRGSGARSLAGMAPVSGRYRRPLLGLTRSMLRAACTADGLAVWDDPHNADPAFARVRVRDEALPALERAVGPGVSQALARTARLLRDDVDALDAWAQQAYVRAGHPDGGLDVSVLADLPAAVRRRVARAALLAAGCPGGSLTADHLLSVDALVAHWHGQGPVALPGGIEVRRRCGRLVLRQTGDEGVPAAWT